MASFLDFLPLYVRTEDQIRADMDADANLGLQPEDPDWVDTRPPGFFYTVTQPFVAEAARLHDYISTLPAVAFIEFAFGEYLDYHATTLNTERQAATQAVGSAVFTGTVGTVITQGTQVSTEQTDANVEAIQFETTATDTIYGPLATPTSLAGAVTTGGTLPPATLYYKVVATDAAGSTLASNEYAAVVSSGNDKKVTLTWNAVPNARGYMVYRGTAAGAENLAFPSSTNGLVDTGSLAWITATVPTSNTTGGKVAIPIHAQVPGAAGNVTANALTVMVTYNSGVSAVTNPAAATGGEDVEDDEQLRERLLIDQVGEGPGNISDYVRWGLDWPSVSRAEAIPLFNGPGTVGLVVMDQNGGPVDSATVAALQANLDPYPAQGAGTAPIDHTVLVMTTVVVPVNVTASITFKPTYSLDGVGGTIAQRANIIQAISDYLNGLDVGDDVLKGKLTAVIYNVEGVLTVNVTVPAADVPINGTIVPPQSAGPGTISLS